MMVSVYKASGGWTAVNRPCYRKRQQFVSKNPPAPTLERPWSLSRELLASCGAAGAVEGLVLPCLLKLTGFVTLSKNLSRNVTSENTPFSIRVSLESRGGVIKPLQ